MNTGEAHRHEDMLCTEPGAGEFAAPSPAVCSVVVPKVSRVMEEVAPKFISHFLAKAKNPPSLKS